MTSADELRSILQSLAGLCATIEEDLADDGLPAAASSNSGASAQRPRSRPPLSLVSLDYIISDVAPRIKGWCTELQRCAHVTGLPMGQPLNVWVAWLARHRMTLLDQDWGEDAVEELATLTAELHERLHPKEPERPKLPDFATAEELATVMDKSVAAIHRWCNRHLVEHWTIGGVKHYKTTSVLRE